MDIRIETPNLVLVAATKDMMQSALEANEQLANNLNVKVPDSWTEMGTGPLVYVLEKLSAGDDQYGWWTYFPIHKKDNSLIGSGGYKGRPKDGTVEIGYEIAPDYRNKGLATEYAQALIDRAFAFPDIHTILAHTLAADNASTAVLTKCGFQKTEEINDPEDGLIWKWELKRK